uniref:hypothetical protein n=1 Tax=Bergeriella denitrificans TaxID=494 RepID=UPI001C3FCA37
KFYDYILLFSKMYEFTQAENRQIFVIPAQAGIQNFDISVIFSRLQEFSTLDSRLRGNDESSRLPSVYGNTFLKIKKYSIYLSQTYVR